MDYLSPEVTQARQKAQTAAERAGSLEAGSGGVADLIRKKTIEAYSENQDIIKPLDKAQSDYMSAPATGRDLYQDIFNPFARERLVSQYTANKSLPMLSLSSILGQRMGSQADLVDAGTAGYEAQVGAAQNQATLAQQQYDSISDEYYKGQQLQMERAKLAASQQKNPLQDMIQQLITGQMGPQEQKWEITTGPRKGEVMTESQANSAALPDGTRLRKVAASEGTGGFDLNTLLGYAAALEGDYTSASNILAKDTKVDAATKKRMTALNQAKPSLSEMARLALAAPAGVEGSWMAMLGGAPGVEGGSAEDLKRVTEGLAKQIAGTFAGEVGIATDEDIKRWTGLMPKPGDTMDERMRALNRLTNQVNAESIALGMGMSGLFPVLRDPRTGQSIQPETQEEYDELVNKGMTPY